MRKRALLLSILLATPVSAAETDRHVPTIEDLLNLETVDSARISPDGKWIAYTVREANFDVDEYVTHIWLVDTETRSTFQLTRGKHLASNPKWSPDGKWLAFTSNRSDEKTQIYAIRPNGGEAIPLTASESEVSDYEWAPDGKRIAYTASEPESDYQNKRKDQMGDFHGGPTGIDLPFFRENRTYPVDIWAGRGAIILKVNYRGSAGYGEAFRKLNMRNLGVGDAWDVLSGVDHLIDKGWVDPERVGCMGWSQGGYISASSLHPPTVSRRSQ